MVMELTTGRQYEQHQSRYTSMGSALFMVIEDVPEVEVNIFL
jgi:hypothetical protein